MFDRRLWFEAQAARVSLLLALVFGGGTGLLIVLQAHYLSRIIDRVFLAGAELASVSSFLVAFFIVIIGRMLTGWVSEVSASYTGIIVKTKLREQLHNHYLALGPLYTRGQQSGEISATLIEGIEALDTYFSQYLPQLILAALIPLTVATAVLFNDLLSAVILLVTAPLIPLFMVLIGKTAEKLTRRQWATLSLMSGFFHDLLQGLTTLKRLGQSRYQAGNIIRTSEQFRDVTLRVLRVAFLSALALELLATISVAIIAVEIGLRLLNGGILFENALFILILAPEFYLPLRGLGVQYHNGLAGQAAANKIFQILDTPVDPLQDWQALMFNGPRANLTFELPLNISFQKVSCHYEDVRYPALEAVSFELNPGEIVALVGRSGAGKSTIANLLLGFLRPSAGRIAVNGKDLGEIEPGDWLNQIAWVPQQPFLFKGTVLENIQLASSSADLEVVKYAAQQALAHDFIQALPHGYHTAVGEKGSRLSRGQAQRIALARAFLKNARLLIMDEPSSNLDPELEDELQVATRQLLHGRSALIIAHRLPTVYQADRIIVLDHGRIVQSGRHADLLTTDGPYRNLVGVGER